MSLDLITKPDRLTFEIIFDSGGMPTSIAVKSLAIHQFIWLRERDSRVIAKIKTFGEAVLDVFAFRRMWIKGLFNQRHLI